VFGEEATGLLLPVALAIAADPEPVHRVEHQDGEARAVGHREPFDTEAAGVHDEQDEPGEHQDGADPVAHGKHAG
jgi:hypothetical protein